MRCPFHDDKNPSSGFYTDTELFHCFACGFTIPPDVFYAKLREVSKAEARKMTDQFWESKAPQIPKDQTAILRIRREGELLLTNERARGYKAHAALAEGLDKVIFQYERGLVDLHTFQGEYAAWKQQLEATA